MQALSVVTAKFVFCCVWLHVVGHRQSHTHALEVEAEADMVDLRNDTYNDSQIIAPEISAPSNVSVENLCATEVVQNFCIGINARAEETEMGKFLGYMKQVFGEINVDASEFNVRSLNKVTCTRFCEIVMGKIHAQGLQLPSAPNLGCRHGVGEEEQVVCDVKISPDALRTLVNTNTKMSLWSRVGEWPARAKEFADAVHTQHTGGNGSDMHNADTFAYSKLDVLRTLANVFGFFPLISSKGAMSSIRDRNNPNDILGPDPNPNVETVWTDRESMQVRSKKNLPSGSFTTSTVPVTASVLQIGQQSELPVSAKKVSASGNAYFIAEAGEVRAGDTVKAHYYALPDGEMAAPSQSPRQKSTGQAIGLVRPFKTSTSEVEVMFDNGCLQTVPVSFVTDIDVRVGEWVYTHHAEFDRDSSTWKKSLDDNDAAVVERACLKEILYNDGKAIVQMGGVPRVIPYSYIVKYERDIAGQIRIKETLGAELPQDPLSEAERRDVETRRVQAHSAVVATRQMLSSPHAQTLMEEWFGDSMTGTQQVITRVLNSIDLVLTNVEFSYPGGACVTRREGIAYVNEAYLRNGNNQFVVNLCRFWFQIIPVLQLKTFVHESSHHETACTKDWSYGEDKCKQLAKTDEDKATKNADTYGLFVVDVFFTAMMQQQQQQQPKKVVRDQPTPKKT